MFTKIVTEYWQCNCCRKRGPEFEGTASDVRPQGWLIGSVDLGEGTKPDTIDIELAICPACRPEFVKAYG